MTITKVLRSWLKRMTFHGLSIQQRLPLLICILLCIVILSFSFISYYGVKKATLEIGKKRLHSLTEQISTLFARSSLVLKNLTLETARKDSIRTYVRSGGTELRTEALGILNKLKNSRNDSTWILVGLLDSNRVPLLWSGNKALESALPVAAMFSSLSVGADSCKMGKLHAVKDTMYYPVVATITDNKRITGYLVGWRSLSATPKGLEQLSQLMGTGATLYFGNTDGSLWTNLNKPVPNPPLTTQHSDDFYDYIDLHGNRVIAAVQPITSTQWLLLIEFSERTMLETANNFLRWTMITGAALTALGIFFTWIMSRNIIKPLNQLTTAAIAIASGDYSSPVEVTRMDELGKLGHAFNTMAEQIHVTQLDLEKKISERTAQLEKANKELGAFSYSISHDLRAPLRGITGFTSMLDYKHGDKLDDDAKRMIAIINKNALRMGNLIDDLLSFSRLGRQEIIKSSMLTNNLIREVITDLVVKEQEVSWHIHSLPDTYGDVNTIRQVWINLISNAVKYSKNAASPSIEIGSFDKDGQTAFFVKDNGVGFDLKYADKLFKVFQRLHGINEFEGTGVGLAIVEKIVSRHGGKVWVEAEKDRGATFYFSLPAKHA